MYGDNDIRAKSQKACEKIKAETGCDASWEYLNVLGHSTIIKAVCENGSSIAAWFDGEAFELHSMQRNGTTVIVASGRMDADELARRIEIVSEFLA
jgi:hypothetical protein